MYTPERAVSSENPINFDQMAVKRQLILYMAVKRRVMLYMRAYISTRTNIVLWIDQVYQQISLKNPFNFNSQPKYPIFFDRTIFPCSPPQHLSINELKVFPWTMVQDKCIFSLFSVTSFDHYSTGVYVEISVIGVGFKNYRGQNFFPNFTIHNVNMYSHIRTFLV